MIILRQKTFTSVKAVKKLSKRIINAATKSPAEGKKEIGKVIATSNRNGLATNSEKYIENKGFEKAAKGIIKATEKVTGKKMTGAEKAKFIENAKSQAKTIGKDRISKGNKDPKFSI